MCKQIFNKYIHQTVTKAFNFMSQSTKTLQLYGYINVVRWFPNTIEFVLHALSFQTEKFLWSLVKFLPCLACCLFLQKMCNELVCKNHTLSALLCSRCLCVVFVNSPSLPSTQIRFRQQQEHALQQVRRVCSCTSISH